MARTTDLAIALREARARRGLSVQEAADKIGVARNTVANWEAGLPPANPAMLLSIELGLGLDRGFLLPLWKKARRTRRRRSNPATEAA